jgi:hypothetical protein
VCHSIQVLTLQSLPGACHFAIIIKSLLFSTWRQAAFSYASM